MTGHVDCVVLASNGGEDRAVIRPAEGGRLEELVLGGVKVIGDPHPRAYTDSYAAAILFPFANRVADGRYTFEGASYQLSINETGRGHALHGLVYDREFRVISSEDREEEKSVTLEYVAGGVDMGFPFSFGLKLIYTLSKLGLSLMVVVENLGADVLPYTLGWHPYFLSSDRGKSQLNFSGVHSYPTDAQSLSSVSVPNPLDELTTIGDRTFDDTFSLERGTVTYTTPGHAVVVTSDALQGFLQVYTPPESQAVAIEPTSGISDSFNHGIGLAKLPPSASAQVTWTVRRIA